MSQIHSMDKTLYPHNYECKRHHYKVQFPYYIPWTHLTDELQGTSEWSRVLNLKEYSGCYVSEEESRAYDQFIDGKAPLVIARKAFDLQREQELESLTHDLKQAVIRLRKKLGRPLQNGAIVPERNNTYWQRLTNLLANPIPANITFWESVINDTPHLSQSLEKIALTANIFSSKKFDYFKGKLTFCLAHCIDGVFLAQSILHDEEIAEKDAVIARERNSKEAAQRALNEKQQAENANVTALRNLEQNKETYLRILRQQLGKTRYDGQFVDLQPAYAQLIAQQTDNPPVDQIQIHEQELSSPELDPLYNLIIKKAQAEPHNAKALLILVMAHLRFVTANAHACPVIERLNQANANLTRAQELQRKTQADLEAAQKGKADAEGTITALRNEKTELVRNYASAIANVTQQKDQIGQRANRAFQELAEQIAPLRQELPHLRTRVREQDIEIQALRRALEPRNQQ